MKSLLILGIESSCDETATALYDSETGLIGHQVFSQIDLHKKYGGVVPELASRDHIRKLLPMIDHLLKETEKSLEDIDAIAYTAGPGLSGALLVGSVMANGLAFSLGIPSVPIHHMEAHLLAPLLEQESAKMPFIALLVSGGHTLLVLVKSKGEYELVGQTLDDAAGEAFDKAAKLLGLNYPGGPEIAKLAVMGEPDIFDFPRPLSKDKGSLDFSFSGLKTSLMYRVKQLREDDALDDQCRADLSYAYQEAIVDSLVGKTELAVTKYEINSVVIAGGVGANKKLRTKMVDVFSKKGVEVIYPSLEFCTDNAAMIALTGLYRFQQGIVNKNYQITVNPRWSIDKIYEGKNAYG